MSVNEFEKLLNRYNEGKSTPEEKILIEEWLNEMAYGETSPWQSFSTDDKQKFIDHLFSRIGSSIDVRSHTINKSLKNRRNTWYIAVAASISLCVLGYFFIEYRAGQQLKGEQWQKIVSEPGHQKQLQLRDGTKVWLQGGSELMYPATFDRNDRFVQLEGEAFFEVSQQEDRPFIVKSGNLETKVLGTSFNIEAYGGLMRYVVSLVTGKVAVQLHSNNADNVTIPTLLSPNEELVYHLETGKLEKSLKTAMQQAESYKSGNMNFEEADLHEVLFTLGKAYGLDIQYDIAAAKSRKMTGSFALRQPVDEVFKSLAATTGGSYSRKGRKIVFSF